MLLIQYDWHHSVGKMPFWLEYLQHLSQYIPMRYRIGSRIYLVALAIISKIEKNHIKKIKNSPTTD